MHRLLAQAGMAKETVRLAAMLLTCTILSMPKLARPPNKAKQAPSQAHLRPKPFLIAYMGPPTKWLRLFFSRKCTAKTTSQYLVAIPTNAVHHIQNRAPGPPKTIAVATPAILPVPT